MVTRQTVIVSRYTFEIYNSYNLQPADEEWKSRNRDTEKIALHCVIDSAAGK